MATEQCVSRVAVTKQTAAMLVRLQRSCRSSAPRATCGCVAGFLRTCVHVYLCPIACVLDKAPRLRIHSISIHWQKLHIQSHEEREKRKLGISQPSQHPSCQSAPMPQMCLFSTLFMILLHVPPLAPFTISTTLSRPDERPFQ